jgi:transposase InsO family protein
VKRRLKDFDISFPRSQSLQGARLWLRAWQTYYNWVRTHLTLGGPPCGSGSEPEPHRLFKLLQEAKP